MAYRRRLFEDIGYFDAALDVGTVANGGGDLEMFFRLLKEGHTLVYEPSAIVRHRHRRNYEQLRTQIANTGVGCFSYLVRSALAYPDEWFGFLRAGMDRMFGWNLQRLLTSFVHPSPIPRDLILVELVGSFVGLGRYQKARSLAVKMAKIMGTPVQGLRNGRLKEKLGRKQLKAIAIRTVDLSDGLQPLTDLTEYERVRVHVSWKRHYIDDIEIAHGGAVVSTTRLAEAIAQQIGLKLLDLNGGAKPDAVWNQTAATLADRFLPQTPLQSENESERLPEDVAVSVVVVARNHPAELEQCLRSIAAQKTSRTVQVVVVDTSADSEATRALLKEQFPNIVVVNEARKGLAYARNAGFIASRGAIVLTIDESMSAPADWLETLLAPFVQSDVMAVTGNVLCREVETPTQRLFDHFGLFGRGSHPIEAGSAWFRQFRFSGVPAWALGTGANAAFRATLFSDPQIGLLEESLGEGEPNACEESYLFYQILRTGYKVIYQPSACVWHSPPAELALLQAQIYRHAQAQAAYFLTTLMRDHDLGSLLELIFHLPRRWAGRFFARLRGTNEIPLSLLGLELAGFLSGPMALAKSIRLVNRLGRSGFYIPVSQRGPEMWSDLFLDPRVGATRT